MKLFAIVGSTDEEGAHERNTVELFLKQQLNKELVDEYLNIYDEDCKIFQNTGEGEKKRKRTAVSSVKVIVICKQINEELTQKQKIVVLLRLMEFVKSARHIEQQKSEFVSTVASTFNIPEEEYQECLSFVTEDDPSLIRDSAQVLLIRNKAPEPGKSMRFLKAESLSGDIMVLWIKSAGIYIIRCFGTTGIYLNGHFIGDNRIHLLTQGSTIRSSKLLPVYYSDIVSCFFSESEGNNLSFEVNNIEFVFAGGKKGLHPISFAENSGKMIGIMGGSGAGKSTLLNVLNGNEAPSSGKILINGKELHRQKKELEGVVGYVPQDDLLIDELTVYQNLFYNTRLCFAQYTDEQIDQLVNSLLLDLGLEETRNLRVGNPLKKTISGGQRKRLNIALELIREPSVLFVDEPTSGLSSRDSENIMDLLKELSLKGKLVFVVIHQPSSDIFKMFDKLLIMDLGGYPIYYGNPVEALIYFKSAVHHINAEEAECESCGNVNPELVFNIIESKVLDENGTPTHTRKKSPTDWNELYLKNSKEKTEHFKPTREEIRTNFKKPGFFSQMKVYLTRDVLSKMSNVQYMAINFLEAPVLALILALLTKFYQNKTGYIFSENKNMIAYMFMCVVVSLFIGLTVSAEEIIKDSKVLKREAFLNLSRGSYLTSKVLLLFLISAFQTFTFVLVGNSILGIKGMYCDYWLVLFTTSCFANMLGLNISSSFNSAVTIYILIPFLLIPQLLLSGVIVKFDELHPSLSGKSVVPLTGDLMASRWAFEALAVNQFVNNEFEKNVYAYDKAISNAAFKKTYWSNRLVEAAESCANPSKKDSLYEENLQIMQNEIPEEAARTGIAFNAGNELKAGSFNEKTATAVKEWVGKIKKHYSAVYNQTVEKRDAWYSAFDVSEQKKKQLQHLTDEHHNQKIQELVTNYNPMADLTYVENGRIYQYGDPVFRDALPGSFIRAHLYAPNKYFFGKPVSTFWMNLVIIWLMSLLMFITLYFDALKKLLTGITKLRKRK